MRTRPRFVRLPDSASVILLGVLVVLATSLYLALVGHCARGARRP